MTRDADSTRSPAVVFLLLLLAAGCGTAVGRKQAAGAPAPARALQNPVAASADGAVAHWSFDEAHIDGASAVDTGGGGHDGEILGARLVAGRVGQALEFDGPSGGVTVTGLGFTGKKCSIALWIRRGGEGVRRLLFINGLFQVGFADSALFVHTGRVGRADTNLPLADVGIPKGEWVYLAVIWDTAAAADNVKVYVNGRLRATATLDAARDRDLRIDTLHIGHTGSPGGSDQNFRGAVDEVTIYGDALPAGRIYGYYRQVLAAAGEPVPVPVERRIISQGGAEAEEPYFPESAYTGRRKIIRVGSELISRMLGADSIAAADLPQKVVQWQQTGLDGCVFTISSTDRNDPGRYHNMCGQWWALVPRRYEEFLPDIRAFQAVADWGRITDNFLWSSYAVWKDGDKIRVQDWFNDDHWRIILANVSLQARVARDCGFKGILLDMEQYEGHHAVGAWHIPFSYPNYAEGGYRNAGDAEPRPFVEVAAKIRQRGTQYAQALCSKFPGIRIFIIPGLYEWTTRLGTDPLAENHNGLYPAFLDGVLLGLDENATIIGGSELTYSLTRDRDMAKVRREFDAAIARLSAVAGNLRQRIGFAAGVWVDPERRWSDTDESVNARGVEEHREAVAAAFRVSDEYAWLYGEKSFFLIREPTPLLRKYFRATDEAHPR